LVSSSLATPESAVTFGQRIVALCRQLAEDESGDRELWQVAAELFELSSVANTNAHVIVARVRQIAGDDERAIALKVLGHVLATWHASPSDAIRYQLSIIGRLQQWFPAGEAVCDLLLVPHIVSYWRHVARDRRFAFSTPAITVAAIESAAISPEGRRIHTILSDAAADFRISGADAILRELLAVPSAATQA